MVQQNLNTGVFPSPAMLVWPNPATKELAQDISGSVRAFTCPPEGHRVTARTLLASLPSWSQILVGKRPELNSWPSRKSPEQKKPAFQKPVIHGEEAGPVPAWAGAHPGARTQDHAEHSSFPSSLERHPYQPVPSDCCAVVFTGSCCVVLADVELLM